MLLAPFALATTLLTSPAQIGGVPMAISPRMNATQAVGIAAVTLDYSRPGVKGRRIFGELEPFGQVWRTGANASTKITFSDPLTVGGKSVAAGTYALYTIPDKDSWTVILSRNVELWGAGGYDPKDDALRVEVEPQVLPAVHETLTIDLERFHSTGADLFIAWERTKVALPLRFETDAKMRKAIDEQVRSATGDVAPDLYYSAGMYMYDRYKVTGDEAALAEASDWVGRAAKANPSKYWQGYFDAEIAHAMGDTARAKIAARKALAAAREADTDFGYGIKCRLLLAKLDG